MNKPLAKEMEDNSPLQQSHNDDFAKNLVRKGKCKLKELRKKIQFTLDDLSKLTKLSASYLSRIESGGRRLNTDTMTVISNALGCAPVDLISSDNETNTKDYYAPKKDLQIFATMPAEGNQQHALANFKEAVAYTFRMPELLGSPAAFGLFVCDDKNAPKYRKNDLIIVDPSRPVFNNTEIGAPVLLINSEERIIIGELISHNESSVTIKSFKEGNQSNFERSSLKAVYRIVCNMEAYLKN